MKTGIWTKYNGAECVIRDTPPRGNLERPAGALFHNVVGPCEFEEATVNGMAGTAYKVEWRVIGPFPQEGFYYVFVPK